MPTFTSDRERRLWFWAAAVVLAIYATLGLAGTLAGLLRDRNLLDASFGLGLLVVMAAIVGSGIRRRPGGREFWIAAGVVAVYGIVILRMGIGPEERTHLIEYAVVALLLYHALDERRRNGGPLRSPAVLAIAVTALLGLVDELIQALIPSRVFDYRDIGFNALAALMAVTGSVVVGYIAARLGSHYRN
jgi:hypothetical protein